jgi:HEAT repeat protein
MVLGGLVRLDPKPKAAAKIYRAAINEKGADIKVAAARGLWEIDRDAPEVVPALKVALAYDPTDAQSRWRTALPLIRSMGPAAKGTVPELLMRMRGPEGENIIEIGLALVAVGPPAVEQIMDLLGGMGPELPPARTNLKNPALQPMLAQILGLIGKASVDDALDQIEAMNPRAREAACRALAACGPLSKPALKKLQAALKDDDPEVQRYAAEALGNLGDDAKESAEALAHLVGHENPDVRLAALKALARLKTEKKLKLDAGMKGVKDTIVASQVAGVELLWQADPKHGDIVPRLTELLDRDTARPTLLPLVARMGRDANELIPALVKLFDKKDGTLSHQVVDTICRIGTKETVPVLLDAIRRKVYLGGGGMPDAYATLHAIGLKDRAAIPILVAELRHQDPDRPSPHLYELLGRFKEEAKSAVKDLKQKALSSYSPYERVLAAKALTRIDPETMKSEVLPALREQSKKENGGAPAALVLWRLDPGDEEMLALLRDLIIKDRGNTHKLIESLGQFGPEVKDMLQTLEAMREQPSYRGWTILGVALARISGKQDQLDRVMPWLLDDILNDRNRSRWKATQLLAEIGPSAKGAVPTLLLLSRHSSPGISMWIERALRKIDPEAAARVGVR